MLNMCTELVIFTNPLVLIIVRMVLEVLVSSPKEAWLLLSVAFLGLMVHFLKNCQLQNKERKRNCRGKTRRVRLAVGYCLIHPLKLYHDSSGLFSWQQYLKKLHMQERAVEEVKLAIKPFYQRRDINKDEYKEILRKAVQKVGLGLSKT